MNIVLIKKFWLKEKIDEMVQKKDKETIMGKYH